MAFLPNGDLIVTERPAAGADVLNPTAEGHVRIVTPNGTVSVPLTGVPDNAGVLDVTLDPNYAQNHVVYFSYLNRDPSSPRVGRDAGDTNVDPAGIAVARAVLDLDNPAAPALIDTKVIWNQQPKIVSNPGSGEPGGRLAFSPDGTYLYISAGDRQEFAPDQTLDDTLGKIVRIYPDGTVPADNPFADVAGALPENWTLGHRNPYGLVFDANGVLWENEMGPMGGDELNVIQKGENFGWPNVSYGNNYDGSPIPKPAAGDGYAASALYWDPVIAPSGMISYSGKDFPVWQGDLILSGLQSKGLVVVKTDGTTASQVARIDLGVRTRDVVQAPDGSLWVLFDQPDGRLVRLTPLAGAATGTAATPASVVETPLPTGGIALTTLTGGHSVGVRTETTSSGGSALAAQIYGADGQKTGSEIILNQTTAGDQGAASVAATASGGFAVAYVSRAAGAFDAYLQLFAADGTATGSKILINDAMASFHSPPAIAVLQNGDIAVSWLGDDGTDITNVQAQLFTAGGTKIGGNILASDNPGSGKIGEAIVALTGGGFAISWTDTGVEADAYGNANTAVRTQVFSSSGAKIGGALTVNTATAGNQDMSSLAALPTGGGFVAVWRDDGYAYASSTGTQGVWAQSISATGVKMGAPVKVSGAGEYGYAPSVAILPGVGFDIVWEQEPVSAVDARTIMSRLFDFSGNPLGAEFQVASGTAQSAPSVTGGAGNRLIFGWTNAAGGQDTASYDIIHGSSEGQTLAGTSGQDVILGGAGDDVIKAGAGADILTGGAGVDTFTGTEADLSGDTISDLALGEKIVFSDASLANFAFSSSGSTLSFTGGQLTVSGIPAEARFIAAANPGGGVALTLQRSVRQDDANGDGHSDILWRNDSGQLSEWLGTANGGFTDNGGIVNGFVPLGWHVEDTGDFNGDGRGDILWRNDSGQLSDWLGTANGSFADNGSVVNKVVAASWHIKDTGDFNGDGRSDILWQNDSGELSDWLGTANGGFTDNGGIVNKVVAASWHIKDTGDFNGDGRSDILWQNDSGELSDWLGTTNGGFTDNGGVVHGVVDASWHIENTGDFNGDGRSDILWRNDSGELSEWLGTTNGGFADNGGVVHNLVSNSWHIENSADFNGDGRSDILWRNDSGQLSEWLGTSNGGFADNGGIVQNVVSASWHIQTPNYSAV